MSEKRAGVEIHGSDKDGMVKVFDFANHSSTYFNTLATIISHYELATFTFFALLTTTMASSTSLGVTSLTLSPEPIAAFFPSCLPLTQRSNLAFGLIMW